jgi:hypothetical protein
MNTLKRHRRNAQGLDRNTAERMFVGLAADDAPPDYAAVAAVLAAAAASADGSSTAPGEYAAMRAYRDAVYSAVPAPAGRRFQPWRTAAGRIAVFATAGALALGGGVAAAATGSLPAPAQRVAHHILGGLGVPADVTPDAVPANVDRRDANATTSPGLLVRESVRTPKPTTTEVIPAQAPVAAADTTTDDTITDDTITDDTTTDDTTTTDDNAKNDHGEAVSSIARSVDPGPGHGAAVCFVASEGACIAGDRGDSDSATDRRSEPGAENSAKSHRSETGAENSSKSRQNASGAVDEGTNHRSATGAENSAKSHQSETGATNSAKGRQSGASDGADGED